MSFSMTWVKPHASRSPSSLEPDVTLSSQHSAKRNVWFKAGSLFSFPLSTWSWNYVTDTKSLGALWCTAWDHWIPIDAVIAFHCSLHRADYGLTINYVSLVWLLARVTPSCTWIGIGIRCQGQRVGGPVLRNSRKADIIYPLSVSPISLFNGSLRGSRTKSPQW